MDIASQLDTFTTSFHNTRIFRQMPSQNPRALHSMLRCTLARGIALQDVVVYHLRPCSRVLSPRFTANTPSFSRAASSTTDPSHSSLSSFLDYAKRTSLDRASTTFTGTYYEYATQSLLRRYGFDLTRVGGRGDRGVDLKGSWTIATTTSPENKNPKIEVELPVIVQCKRLQSKVLMVFSRL